jgi:hypothetical protein
LLGLAAPRSGVFAASIVPAKPAHERIQNGMELNPGRHHHGLGSNPSKFEKTVFHSAFKGKNGGLENNIPSCPFLHRTGAWKDGFAHPDMGAIPRNYNQ